MARRKDPAADAPPEPEDGPVEASSETSAVADSGQSAPFVDTDPPPAPTEPPVQAEAAAPQVAPVVVRRSGFLGPVLGGALAAAAGFGLAQFNVLGLSAPNASSAQDTAAALAALDQRLTEALAQTADPAALAALQAEVKALSERVAALESAPPPAAPDISALDDLGRRLDAIEAIPPDGAASTAALTARLAELERRLDALPQGTDQAKVDEALARLEAAEAEAAQKAEEAAAAAAAMERDAALDRLREAVANGTAFETELATIGDPALTEALSPHAAGVATLGALQAEFPDAARASLALSRDGAAEEGWGARLLGFLADQTGARSVTPREGDSPDAILSRAEFALGEGRLDAALAELQALDEGLRAPFGDWIAKATARLSVMQALEGL